MAAGVTVLGPFTPREFSNTSQLSSTITNHTSFPSGTIVSCEPITVLGNVFLVIYHSS